MDDARKISHCIKTQLSLIVKSYLILFNNVSKIKLPLLYFKNLKTLLTIMISK
jgi:hypothetical protein